MNKRTQTKLVAALNNLTNGAGNSPTLYIDRDHTNQVVLSAESGDGFADYYGANDYPHIDPRVEQAAADLGLYWEWENAGALIAYEI